MKSGIFIFTGFLLLMIWIFFPSDGQSLSPQITTVASQAKEALPGSAAYCSGDEVIKVETRSPPVHVAVKLGCKLTFNAPTGQCVDFSINGENSWRTMCQGNPLTIKGEVYSFGFKPPEGVSAVVLTINHHM